MPAAGFGPGGRPCKWSMRVKAYIWPVMALGFAVAATPLSAETRAPKTPLQPAIRLPASHKITVGDGCRPFAVLIRNASTRDQSVWKERCSWGYFNISFEYVGKDGQRGHIEKRPRDWAKNTPDPQALKPGKAYVQQICLNPSTWQGLPDVSGGAVEARIRVIYQVVDTPEAGREHVWTGRGVSDWTDAVFVSSKPGPR